MHKKFTVFHKLLSFISGLSLVLQLFVLVFSYSAITQPVYAFDQLPSTTFSIIALPDTQVYSRSYPSTFNAQTQFAVGNKNTLNIAFLTHEGDIVDTASDTTQWQNADTAMAILDTGGIQYSVGPGNHDIPLTNYNTYFGVSRFSGKSYYGGHYGTGNEDNYSLFSAGGMNFIMVNLEYNPSTAVLTWADALLKTYSTRKAIVESHSILNVDNSWSNSTIYSALKDNPNLFMMLCGHMNSSTDGAAMRTETADNGNTVYILMADYQDYPNGGNGYLRIMEFQTADNKIQVLTYSPTLQSYLTDSQNQFTINYGSGPTPTPTLTPTQTPAPTNTPTPTPTPTPTLTPTPTVTPTPTPTPKPGDASGDNKVDEADYTIWLSHYGQSLSGVTNGDFNNNGKVDGIDYTIWLNNYGK